jgi:hypothetical protein
MNYIDVNSTSCQVYSGDYYINASPAITIPPVITSGLMMYVDGSVQSSLQDPNWLDLSGRDNNGLIINGPTFEPDDGGVIRMDGVNDRVDFVNNPDFHFLNEFTYQFAFKSTLLSSFRALMLHRRAGVGNGTRIGIWTNGSVLYREVSNNARTINNTGNTSLTVATNTWYIITLVLYTSRVLRLYRNLTFQQLATNMQGSFSDQDRPLWLGHHGGFAQNFQGDMAFAMVYNRGLSQLEIEHNYNILKTRLGI